VDEKVFKGLELNLLSDEDAVGKWVYETLDRTILASSFFGDLGFVYLITVSIFDRVLIQGLFSKSDGLQSKL
jgi:hypothetical protein